MARKQSTAAKTSTQSTTAPAQEESKMESQPQQDSSVDEKVDQSKSSETPTEDGTSVGSETAAKENEGSDGAPADNKPADVTPSDAKPNDEKPADNAGVTTPTDAAPAAETPAVGTADQKEEPVVEEASRWEAAPLGPMDSTEVQVFQRTLNAYVDQMGGGKAIEVKAGALQQAGLFRGFLQAVGYANGQHFGACMTLLTDALRDSNAFEARYLFRFLDTREQPLSKSQVEEFKDLFTVLVAVSKSVPAERALVSGSFALQRAFRCITNETQRQRFQAWYKQFCNLQ